MDMYSHSPASHHGILTVFVATLLLTSGCSGVLSDVDGSPTPTANASQESTESGLTPANGTDLRRVSVPKNGSTTVSGELDGSDPVNGTTVYESVELTGEPGTHLNVTMETGGGLPAMRLVHPNGTVVATTQSAGLGTTRLSEITLRHGGNYTVEATSVDANTTFKYEFTVEEYDAGYFVGPKSTWNETEQYLSFGQDFATTAKNNTLNGQVSTRLYDWDIRPNPSEDYLVLSYRMDGENQTVRQRYYADQVVPLTYAKLDSFYQNVTNNPEYAENEPWAPEVIYLRTENPQGELYRTNFLRLEWARDYAKTGNLTVYQARYVDTEREGPGSPRYEPGGDESTNESQFPIETYDDYTPLEERLINETTERD